MTYEEILQKEPFGLKREEKQDLLMENLSELTEYHMKNCAPYSRMMNSIGFELQSMKNAEDFPFIPVRLFKDVELFSVPKEEIFKTMTSSGTTGQRVSKIFLDRETASNQQKTLVKIVSNFTGHSRMPMIIIDCPSVVKNRAMFSARGAGILGFSIFGRQKIYALDDDMNLQIEKISEFIKENAGKKIFLFGFTFMIWKYFYEFLYKNGLKLDLSNAVMIHGGGWKKLQDQSVSSEDFRKSLCEVCGITEVFDYYGMVEQTGCIYVECEAGHLHASSYSDVITRNPKNFSVCKHGEEGIIQVISLLPKSYPGHSLLTEDLGIILGEDDCSCGRKGKYFKILGRLKSAELRGCSDTYASEH